MAGVRGRSIATMGGFLTPILVSGQGAGQPFRVRSWGIPTEWYDRPSRWNFKLLPQGFVPVLTSAGLGAL